MLMMPWMFSLCSMFLWLRWCTQHLWLPMQTFTFLFDVSLHWDGTFLGENESKREKKKKWQWNDFHQLTMMDSPFFINS